MGELSGKRVTVAGAGALGLSCALALARAGAAVTVFDPAPLGCNASGVAAGMLAPAMEAALDPVSEGHFQLLRRARDLWPAFVADVPGAVVHRCGALWAAELDEEALHMEARLRALGAEAELVSAEAARAMSPGLVIDVPAVFTPEDWRIEPMPMLVALARAIATLGGQIASGRMSLPNALHDADAVVLSTGMASSEMAPELAALAPIKGQIARLSGGPSTGPIVRAPGLYIVPGQGGALAGATMEAGVSNPMPEAAVAGGFAEAVRRYYPALPEASVEARAGIRAATPDGLPLVGASSTSGVFLAVGARRNGWLLAPLVAEAVTAALTGAPPSVPEFAPGRFLA